MSGKKRPSARRAGGTSGKPESIARMAPERRVIRVGDRDVPFLAGALHYFRTPREHWRTALAEIAHLGLPMVETYVPWQVHEVGKGRFDFGEIDPQKDLAAFLDLAKELGLLVILRPGPHINSEMTYFGLPERIVFDRACQARSPSGGAVVLGFPPRMFPVPSYASETYLAETDTWYGAFAEVARPHLFPRGPVVLLQVDNEATYFFRDAPYDQDYHPDAIGKWHAFLRDHHPTVADLSRAHRASYERFEDCTPPTRFDAHTEDDETSEPGGLAIHLEWQSFREQMITDSLRRMKSMLERHGLGSVPTFHNLPLGELSAPVSLAAIERVVDFVGLDYYHARREHRTTKRRTLYLAGTSRMPVSPELGVGAPPWFTPLAHEDSLYTALVALAYGLRGFSLYMAVDRDRWYGAPLDASGTPRLEAATWKLLVRALIDTGFHRLTRVARVALVVPREYVRLSRATHLYGAATPVTLEAIAGSPIEGASDHPLGLKGPVQVLWWKMLSRFADALSRAGEPYVYVDSDVDPERLAGFAAIITPSFEFASVERWKALAHFASHGGHVVYGPAMPSLDASLHARLFEVPRAGSLVLVDHDADADAAVGELLSALPDRDAIAVSPPPLELAVHESEHGPRVLFVINPSQRAMDATLTTPGGMSITDLLDGQSYAGDRTLSVPVPAQTCRFFRIDHIQDRDADAMESAE
jgi:beta-galactosidase